MRSEIRLSRLQCKICCVHIYEFTNYFVIQHGHNARHSQRMELYAFTRVLNYLLGDNIAINSITTDRQKSMKDCCPRILHQFDVVHVSKNTRKKLCAKAKLKKYELLQGWIKPIINHFWQCCATCEENPILLKEKWASVLQHISNEHQWEGFTMYHKCTYDKLSDHDLTAKKWINRVSSTYLALTEITLGDNILRYLQCFGRR